MIPYYALIFLPIILNVFRIENQPEEKRRRNVIGVFFLILTLMLVLRHMTIGRDLAGYYSLFNSYIRTSFANASKSGVEQGYILLNQFVGLFTTEFQWVIVITGLLSILPIWYTYSKTIEDVPLTISLFLIMPTFVMVFSGLRQAISIALGFVAYEFVKKKKLVFFILVCILAMLFHKSAFMLFIMYPLFHAKITRKWLYAVVPAMLIIFLFNRPIFTFLNRVLASMYEGEISNTGAYMMLVLFVMFAIYSFAVVDESRMDAETIGLRNFLLLSVALQMFAPLHALAMRMNYYYLMFIPLLIPKIIKYRAPQWDKIVVISRYIMTLYFLFYFFDHAPSGNILDTFPYKFFWEV
ncbi:MAG: EpsG family protein [Clostridia bacterium]|nr:EpsG family protein [Clostridia bacterium]